LPSLPAELPSAAGDFVESGIPLCIQRQAVRMLAMLGSDVAGAAAVQRAGWIPWLQELAVSQDLKLSSCASRALLHIESAAATQRRGALASLAAPAAAAAAALPPPLLLLRPLQEPLLPSLADAAEAAAAAEEATADESDGAAAGGGTSPGGASSSCSGSSVAAEAAEVLDDARQALAHVKRRLDRQLDAVRPPVPPAQRLVMQVGFWWAGVEHCVKHWVVSVYCLPGIPSSASPDDRLAALLTCSAYLSSWYLPAYVPALPAPPAAPALQDGVHLFDPLAPHHEVLAREGISADSSGALFNLASCLRCPGLLPCPLPSPHLLQQPPPPI
jgi:hypothetical protein